MASRNQHPRRHRTSRVAGQALALGAAALCAACSGNDVGGGGSCGGTALGFPLCGPSPTTMLGTLAFPNLRFDRPTLLTHPPDGTDRLFVLEQSGRIHVFPNTTQVGSTKVYLDLSGRLEQPFGGEEGLLGLAFDPDYRNNGLCYVCYIAGSPSRSVVARYAVDPLDPDRADPASEVVLLEVGQPFQNHNGGMLAFGPDDMLYISLGDGGSGGDPAGNGQDTTTLLGSLLRIDPHGSTGGLPYGIPADNPLVGQGGGVREEIWAYGLRHPWRFSFDRQTGALWLGDVGQSTREEIDLIVRGGNYGWNVFEGAVDFMNPGALPPTAFERPIVDYGTGQGRCVIGGYVYRGNRLPELRGSYLYGDNSTGRVWALVESQGQMVSNTEVASLAAISAFGEDQDGELYVVVHSTGTLWRLDRLPGGVTQPFPALLSETGIFSDTQNLVAAPELVEYSVASALWSDGASKRRFIALPPGATIDFHPTDPWVFPLGTVLVKHFELELTVGDPGTARRLETRVLLREQTGWAGYTYRWNAQQTDAELLGGREVDTFTITDPAAPGGTRQQDWLYPSRTDCLHCHTEAAGRVLGVHTLQLNHDVTAGSTTVNQLSQWQQNGAFSASIGDPSQYATSVDPRSTAATTSDRVRSYLDANCAMCHRPGAPAPGGIDMRFLTPDAQMGLIGVPATEGTLGLVNAHRVLQGVKESSVLWERMQRLDGTRMPPLGSGLVDQEMVQLIGDWIDQLPP